MSRLENYLTSLKLKHQNLHKKIEALEAERAPDISIRNAKIEKLKLKDEIERLQLDEDFL